MARLNVLRMPYGQVLPWTAALFVTVASGFAGLALAQVPPSTAAQSGINGGTALGEVIVTATRRAENIRNVPETISVLTGVQLEAQGLTDAASYASFIPGLSFNETGFGARNGLDFTIRGVSNTRLADSTAGAGALTTGFYIDDVAVVPVDIELYDVSRIEVLKGPQGTLFGQASMGGTIRVITNEPDAKNFSAGAEVTGTDIYQGGQGWGVKGVVNIPLVKDYLALRVVAYSVDDGGWINWSPASLAAGYGKGPVAGVPPGFPNPQVPTALSIKDVNTTKTAGTRITAAWTPTENLTITPLFLYQTKTQPFSSFIDRNLGAGYLTQNYQPEPRIERFTDGALTIRYSLPWAQLTSVSEKFDRDYSWTQDETSYVAGIYGLTPTGNIPATTAGLFDYPIKIASQEFRLVSRTNQYLDWLVGATYFHENRDYFGYVAAPGYNATAAKPIPDNGLINASDTSASYQNAAVYGNLTLKLFDDRLSLSAGGRYFGQKFVQNGSVVTGAAYGATGIGAIRRGVGTSGSQKGFIPRYTIKYSLSNENIIYADVGKGFRAGGPGAAAATLQTSACLAALSRAGVVPGGSFTSDNLMQYELGIKTTTDKMAIGLSTFYSTWNNLQVSLILNTFNNGCNSTVTTNAGKASSKGAEASFEYRPLGALSLSADVTYTKAVLGAPPPGVAVGTEGEPLQNAPIWQGTIGASYTFPVLADYVGTFRTDFSYYGWQWSNQASENNPFFFVHARSLLNFGLSVEPSHGRWSVELFAHNALNREQEYGAQSFFGEPLTNQVLVGAPLTLGLTAKWTFDNP